MLFFVLCRLFTNEYVFLQHECVCSAAAGVIYQKPVAHFKMTNVALLWPPGIPTKAGHES